MKYINSLNNIIDAAKTYIQNMVDQSEGLSIHLTPEEQLIEYYLGDDESFTKYRLTYVYKEDDRYFVKGYIEYSDDFYDFDLDFVSAENICLIADEIESYENIQINKK